MIGSESGDLRHSPRGRASHSAPVRLRGLSKDRGSAVPGAMRNGGPTSAGCANAHRAMPEAGRPNPVGLRPLRLLRAGRPSGDNRVGEGNRGGDAAPTGFELRHWLIEGDG